MQAKAGTTLKNPLPVIDGHVDLVYSMMRFSPTSPFSSLTGGPVTPETLRAGNVRLIVGAFYCADLHNGSETATSHLESLYAFGRKMLEGLTPVMTKEDLANVYDGHGTPGILYLLENADALVDADIGYWQALGIRVVGLTHAGENRIGSGNGVKTPGGFSAEGRRVVAELDRLGMVIDVAHLSDPCFRELTGIFSGPLISSHTGFRRFCNLPRNLSDRQVRGLIERGGMIGVSVNPEMLAMDQRAGLSQVFEQIDWLVQQYGDNPVALGTDFGGFDIAADGLENPGRLPALSRLMHESGYSLSAIENIMGKNWYRFYEAILPVTPPGFPPF
ncbi:MAG: membrane dipeptidase [Pseudomonadota bacterium]